MPMFFRIVLGLLLLNQCSVASLYRLVPQAMNYSSASTYCQHEIQSNLASIHSASDFEEAKTLCQSAGASSCWIGLNDRDLEGDWKWTDGTNFDYASTLNASSWVRMMCLHSPTTYPFCNYLYVQASGEPNDVDGTQDCVTLSSGSGYLMQDQLCSADYYFLCNAPTVAAGWVLAANDVCYSAVNYSDHVFSAPLNGTIEGIKLVYKSGEGVTCDAAQSGYSHWGCSVSNEWMVQMIEASSTLPRTTYYPTNTTQNVNVLNPSGSSSYPCRWISYSMDSSYTLFDDELVFLDTENAYNVDTNDQFTIQYSEACNDLTTSNNAGTGCVDVYFFYAASIKGTCDNQLDVWISYDGTDANYENITSSLNGNPKQWTSIKSATLTGVTDATKLKIACTDEDSFGGLIFSVLYNGAVYSTNGDVNNGGYFELINSSTGSTTTYTPDEAIWNLDSLHAAPYYAHFTWSCMSPGCPTGNRDVYIFHFQTPSPTNAPSTTPTRAPTDSPTDSPSNAPTLTPTACFDRDTNVWTNDGQNEQSVAELILNLKFANMVVNQSQIVIAENDGQYLGINVTDLRQQLECSGIASCLVSRIVFEDNDQCNLLCNELVSCQDATVKMTNCIRAEMICDGRSACDGAVVEVDDLLQTLDELHIHCGSATSCSGMNIVISQTNPDANISVSCYGLNACDGILIETHPANSGNTILNMFSFSEFVEFNNGIGYEEVDKSQQFVFCNTQDRLVEYHEDDTATVLTQRLLSEYANNLFPCDGVTIGCSDENATETASCDMQFSVHPSDVQIASPNPSASCYWVPVADLIRMSCTGTCASSPTYAPTSAPTTAPTIPTSSPSAAPSNAPTWSPSAAPTDHPSNEPTLDPTAAPTVRPSEAPTIAPTMAPSISPSSAPSSSPTQSPSSAPSMSPTSAPSAPPSTSPSSAPSFSPSSAPTESPSYAPSEAPSNAPSLAPSVSPSSAPSFSPTFSPTRYPTQNVHKIYDTKVLIEYNLEGLTTGNKLLIANSTLMVKNDIQSIIESCYFTENDLEYTMFWVDIYAMADVSIAQNVSIDHKLFYYELDIDNRFDEPVTLSAEIQSGINIAGFIISKSQGATFVNEAQQKVRNYFLNPVLNFSVANAKALQQEPIDSGDDDDKDDSNTIIILSVLIVSGGAATSFAAFVFNKKKSTKVDNAKYWMPLLIALNMYDFLSDINLCVAIFESAAELPLDLSNNRLFLAVACLLFVVLPFGFNLYYAIRITNEPTITRNPSARAWFAKHLPQFILLSVASGGTYPVLGLTSSRIFGLDFFNAGLLSADLHSLSKIKLRSTIYMENAPQLLIQIIYSYMIRRLDADTILAFIASSLSIIASVIIFRAEAAQKEACIEINYWIMFGGTAKLDKADRASISLRKGLKERLDVALCNVLGIPAKSIEVGYVTITDKGCSIHVQHSVFHADLNRLQNIRSWDKTETAYDFVEAAFVMYQNKIRDALADHFMISNAARWTAVYQRMSDMNGSVVSKQDGLGLDRIDQIQQNMKSSTANVLASVIANTSRQDTAVRLASLDEEKEEEFSAHDNTDNDNGNVEMVEIAKPNVRGNNGSDQDALRAEFNALMQMMAAFEQKLSAVPNGNNTAKSMPEGEDVDDVDESTNL